MSHIERQLEIAGNNLLDLTMQNRLLNFRPSRSRILKIVDETPAKVYGRLVLSEKAMKFRAKPPQKSASSTAIPSVAESSDVESGEAISEGPSSGTVEEDDSKLWNMRLYDSNAADGHADRYLQTSLEKALRRICPRTKPVAL